MLAVLLGLNREETRDGLNRDAALIVAMATKICSATCTARALEMAIAASASIVAVPTPERVGDSAMALPDAATGDRVAVPVADRVVSRAVPCAGAVLGVAVPAPVADSVGSVARADPGATPADIGAEPVAVRVGERAVALPVAGDGVRVPDVGAAGDSIATACHDTELFVARVAVVVPATVWLTIPSA